MAARTMPSQLPPELILNILDQLVRCPLRQHPIYAPSHPVTKTLRALTLTSRSIYPVASRYLYRRCLYLNDCVSYACFRRTLGLDLGHSHPQKLDYGQEPRPESLWDDAKALQNIRSIFISPTGMSIAGTDHGQYTPLVRLPHVVEVCNIIGSTLKRLILDLQPINLRLDEMGNLRFLQERKRMFLDMPNLEELVASYEVLDYFYVPPPNLKRLAITIQGIHEIAMQFCFSVSTLESLVVLRPKELTARHIDDLFSAYKGKSLDVVFVDVNSNHRTPVNTRDWTEGDTVQVWEADVPTSFYGDEVDLILCDSWVWSHAVQGTLFSRDNRRMASWAEIQRRLAGPVHHIIN